MQISLVCVSASGSDRHNLILRFCGRKPNYIFWEADEYICLNKIPVGPNPGKAG